MTNAIIVRRALAPLLTEAIELWARNTTRASERYDEYVQTKCAVLDDFFAFTGKAPDVITPGDAAAWVEHLEVQGLAPATVYARLCRVSSWYEWAMKDDQLRHLITYNPTKLSRPKPPQPYQNKRAQALEDEEVQALLAVVGRHAVDQLHAKRDYALLLLFVLTGMRRAEIIGLRWGDIRVGEALKVRARVKGGAYVEREIVNPLAQTALLHYLSESGRLERMTPDTPLWTRHDRAGNPGPPLTSHAFAANLKKYAQEAGLPAIHLHQTRHTFARMVAEDTGSIIETQDALGHKNARTTRVYVERIAVKKDKHSVRIGERLGL